MSKIIFIDEKGKLFGLINILDLLVLISLLVLVYLGSSAYLALKTSVPQIVDFSPKRIDNQKAANVTLILKNDRRIGSAKVTMTPDGFAGQKIYPSASFEKRTRTELTVSIPAGAPAGNYLFEMELVLLDVLNRQSVNVLHFANPIAIEKQKEIVVEQEKLPLYPWPLEVVVFFPGDSAITGKQFKVGDTMADSHGRLIAEIISLQPSRASDTLNLTGIPWKKKETPDKGSITARIRLQPEILQNQLAFQGKIISVGERLKFLTESLSLDGYIIGKGDIKYQKISKGLDVLAEVVLLGITKENLTMLNPKFTQIDESGRVWAEVLEVTEDESQVKESYRNVEVRMFLNCLNRKGRLYCQNVLVEKGALLNFSLKGQTVTGLVRRISYPEWIKVVVELQNVTPEIAAHLRSGVKEEVAGRESTMSIEEVLSSNPSYSYNPILALGEPAGDGKRTFVGHPENRDIKCLLKIKAIRVGKRIYYNKGPLLIDSIIAFQTPTWILSGKIAQFIF